MTLQISLTQKALAVYRFLEMNGSLVDAVKAFFESTRTITNVIWSEVKLKTKFCYRCKTQREITKDNFCPKCEWHFANTSEVTAK